VSGLQDVLTLTFAAGNLVVIRIDVVLVRRHVYAPLSLEIPMLAHQAIARTRFQYALTRREQPEM
jgi:hypothetical protein